MIRNITLANRGIKLSYNNIIILRTLTEQMQEQK